VNVTLTPDTRLPPLSFTVACNAVPYAVLIVALCGVPAVAVTVAAAPAVLVSAKSAELAPVALATTLYGPAVLLAVNVVAVATPEELVVVV
jgi:hypothetical protein